MLSGFGAATVVPIKKSPPFKICKIEKLLFMIGTNEKEFKISKRKGVKKLVKHNDNHYHCMELYYNDKGGKRC
jgi:hypothetical protein